MGYIPQSTLLLVTVVTGVGPVESKYIVYNVLDVFNRLFLFQSYG